MVADSRARVASVVEPWLRVLMSLKIQGVDGLMHVKSVVAQSGNLEKMVCASSGVVLVTSPQFKIMKYVANDFLAFDLS
ncbi:hypothetical protein TNCV_1510771 [Trichonephila clavipes]|nr:hypothetical protein TNCV_1510771 [Trichonephila clavipes]